MRKRHLIFGALLAVGLTGLGVWGFDRWIATTEMPHLGLATSTIVTDQNGEMLRAYMVGDGIWRLSATVDDVDPRYLAQLIAYEDKRFYSHFGVDFLAIGRAFGQAVRNRRIISGGSTLTMQVARLLEGGGTGRWGPKARQIRLALALERHLSKRDILNLYLKLAPFGGNLEGVRAASLSYFGREPARLTTAQAALLVALPQSPEQRRPDRFSAKAKLVRDRILDRLVLAGVLQAGEAKAAKTEQVPTRRRGFPAIAAHLADHVVAENPLQSLVRLTVKRPLQVALEDLARRAARREDTAISAAIVVIDHQSGEVLASVGSAGYLDHDRQGFVDMTRAIRSPGSTLKPLIYGLAFEFGLAHPETLITDKPTDFDGYAPQNFDKQSYGTLPMRRALQLSLNIPAVEVLQAVGPARLVARMKRAGVTARLPGQGAPGLAIALGGVGVSLVDLVRLYGTIARGGEPVALRDHYTVTNVANATNVINATNTANTASEDAASEGFAPKRLLSAVAAWQVADILSGVRGPETAPRNHLAYKTGTSYGYRDAWAIGFDGRHVIGVWLGRPDGASVPGISGAKLAAPVLFAAFERLKPRLSPLPAPPPSALIVQNADLPQPLKRFRGRGAVFDIAANPPEIAFPPDGANIDLGLSQTDRMPLILKVRNGTPPFTWIADGVPFLVAARGRQAELHPIGAGYLDISVIDATGQSQRARVKLQ